MSTSLQTRWRVSDGESLDVTIDTGEDTDGIDRVGLSAKGVISGASNGSGRRDHSVRDLDEENFDIKHRSHATSFGINLFTVSRILSFFFPLLLDGLE